MRGSQSFEGEKLTDLRELSGLTRSELADKLQVTQQAVWQYESGAVTPRIEILNQLRELFHVQTSFFYSSPLIEREARPALNVAYRSKDWDSRSKTKYEISYNTYLNYFLDLFDNKIVQHPSVIGSLISKANTFAIAHHPLTEDVIDKLAERVRTRLQINDNQQLMSKLELSGIYIVEKNLGTTIDAYSVLSKQQRPLIVLGTVRKSAVRRNFDLAHELGNLMMHQNVEMEALSKEEQRNVEHEADLFAGFFLLPESEFREDYALIRRKSNPDYYIELKRKDVVSFGAIEMRARRLGMVSYQENRYFWGKMSKNGYRDFEPLDDVLVPRKPGRTRALVKFVIDEGLMSVTDMIDRFKVYPTFVARVLGLEDDFFDQFMPDEPTFFEHNNVIQFPHQ